uniref:Tyrosine-protein phosphatase non-receptor type 20 n=1 Tax=Leptobrachium leishanense TaxID=445787 RepID=A0A8C5WFZ3_9ANUR
MNVSAWRDYNKSFTETGSYWFPPNVTQFKLEMKNGTNYTIYLRGFTSAGAGKPTQWSHETPIADPPVPPVRLHKVLSTSVTTAELALHPVPDIHGPISSYEVIISARNGDNSSDLCAGYTSTHYNSSSSPRLYTAALIPAHNLTEPTTLTLGDGRRYSDFFNAPLHAGQQYSVSVRVTSAWKEVEKWSCVEYSRFTVREPWNVPVAAMAGVGVAVFMLLILVVLLVLWKRGLLRLMGQKSLKTRGIPLKKHDGSGKKKTIPVENFLEIVKNFQSKELMVQEETEEEENSNMLPVGRYSEYKELPPGLLYPCNVATLEENISKNRYKTVIPWPLPGTVADFWHMVWQEKSSVIVMLTGLEEKNKVKCACYWPEQGETYGDITIYLQKVKQTGATITRSFILRKSGVQRVVEHFHYLQWPDHGVPSKHSGLLQVVEQMHICNVPGSGPVIVHCSAGIGRTGTFIALDILLKMGRAENKVNVFTCTSQLRRSRTNMVQDKEQYVFLYNILLETLLCGVTSVAVEDIQVHIHRMGELDPVTKISGYMKEFQELEKLRGLYHIGSYKEGEKPENLAKNRYCSILPGDGCRPILISVSNKQGLPGYINAVFINSNLLNDAFVVTQLPLKQTLGDFWSLVWDYKCTSVVLMHDPPDMSEMTAQFWPEKGEARYGGFIVMKISKVLATGHKEITLCVRPCNEPVDSSLKVKLYQLTIWPKNQSVPLNPSTFIGLIGKLEKHQQQMEGSHVLVTCCDGASRSGLLCAGAIVCDQIRSDGCLDVSQAVRSLKKRRVQLIPNPEQYAFCYTLAQSYLDSFETYGNFTH